VIGIVGAGGIGMQLTDRIRLNAWSEACFTVLLILVTVSVIDVLPGWLRRSLPAAWSGMISLGVIIPLWTIGGA
jgi:ABC-type phosphate/phosphonate transport system permease subunit